MKTLITLLLLTLMVLVGGCGAPAAPAETELDTATVAEETVEETAEEAAPQTAEEPLDLPVDIDVQTVKEIMDRDDVVVIDVREQNEYDESHIPGVVLIPTSEFQNRINEIPTDKAVVFACRSGNRSNQVTQFLQQNGYENVHNMLGGINAWKQAGYEVEQ